jgi:CRISPR/Cas system endoribonuclease Cas6 (RAMP superfamily)
MILKNIFGKILAILVLVALLVLFYLLFRLLISINPNVAAAIIAGLFATSGVLYNQRHNKLKDIAELHRKEKINLYKDFMDYLIRILLKVKNKEIDKIENEDENNSQFFFNFQKNLIIWGSTDVINKYNNFKKSTFKAKGLEILILVDDFLQAIRTDLENSNKGLKRGDLIKVFLLDPEELDRPNSN